MTAVLVLLMIMKSKVWWWGSIQWHDDHTKHHKNLSGASEVVRGMKG
jgi:hypothetical protein